jgi:hypothetical protein
MTIDPNATINSLVSMVNCKRLIEGQSFVEQITLIKNNKLKGKKTKNMEFFCQKRLKKNNVKLER